MKKQIAQSFEIKVWETEEDRNIGESYVAIETNDFNYAKEYGEKIYYKQGVACVEVININTDEVVIHLSGDEF